MSDIRCGKVTSWKIWTELREDGCGAYLNMPIVPYPVNYISTIVCTVTACPPLLKSGSGNIQLMLEGPGLRNGREKFLCHPYSAAESTYSIFDDCVIYMVPGQSYRILISPDGDDVGILNVAVHVFYENDKRKITFPQLTVGRIEKDCICHGKEVVAKIGDVVVLGDKKSDSLRTLLEMIAGNDEVEE